MMGADARRLERMAERGEIPCQKIGGELRFNRAAVTEWLQQHLPVMAGHHLAEVDAGIGAHRQRERDETIITPMLRPEAVATQLKSRGKNSLLRELVSLAGATGLVYDEQALLEAVIAREEQASTAIESGMAMPHPKRPLPYDLVEPILVVGRAGSVVFGAPDGKLTDLFFLMASLDDHHHLHVMARLCRMLSDEDFVEHLRTAETSQDIIDLLVEREQEILTQSV